MWSRSRNASLLALLALFASPAAAESPSLDPNLVHRFAQGPAPGAAAMEGFDARGSGQSPTPLPLSGNVGLRMRIPHGIAHAVATDDRDRIVIAHALPRVSEYDRAGKLLWSARLGAEPAASPVILSDRTRLVVTVTAELIGLSPEGAQRFRRVLPLSDLRSPPLLIALRDGGAAFSNGHDVLRLGQRGEMIFRDRMNDTVRSLIEWRGELLAVTDGGAILRYGAVTGFSTLESFGGRTPEGAATSPAGVLSAVVDRHRIVDVDLAGFARKIRVFDPGLSLLGPPAVLDDGQTRIVANGDLLLGHDRQGAETARIALDAAAGPALADARDPRPVFDARGAAAIARRGLDVALVAPDGRIHRVDGTACGEPIRPTPLAPKSLLVGCRSGQLWRLDP